MCGSSGGQTIYTPPTQQAPSSAEAINAWVASMPQVFAEQQRQAPLEAQQQVGLAQQYALPLAQAYKTAQEELYPGTTGLQENLATQAQEYMGGEMPAWATKKYRSDLAANLGTNVGSPIGADYMSTNMLQKQEDWKRYGQNLALSVTGRQPLTQAVSPTYSNYASSYTPSTAMDFLSKNFQTQVASSQPLAYANKTSRGLFSWLM